MVEHVMTGDEAALAALYDRYSGMLYPMLLRILNDTGAAEEVLQDLFLQLWRGAGRFDANRGTLAAWLATIGRNRALSRLRARRRREVLEEPEVIPFDAMASPQAVEDEVMRMQLSRRLRTAMATLPMKQREALELAYFEGMTQTEIAARTGSPLGTVKSRVRGAIQALKALFEDESAMISRRLRSCCINKEEYL
ncbi:MAG TPA: sigma-70 family RNA polymerase sigma factor [Acidobacteriaceae bacterium]|nr:sigma-70 family RNA polymerase sigma factor [Acidobacteriaceae bacterium]